MRQVLFRIPLDATLSLGGLSIPLFGTGLLLWVWLAYCGWTLWRHYRQQGSWAGASEQLPFFLVIAGVIGLGPRYLHSIPIFGYGASLVLGFLTAAWLAGIRAKREGIEAHVVWDVGMWVLMSGIVGARVFYIVTHPNQFFGAARSFPEFLLNLLNLSQGGLVLYGGVLSGIVVYIGYCRANQLSPLLLADIIIPSIFVGEMFGRIGCFLNGCCYGDQCHLPWAVYFPQGSVPFVNQVNLGFITETAPYSLPIHPTQLYSSLTAGLLALVTWHYYPFRSRRGEVLCLGWLLYPITRFLLEFLRGDTPGEFGTDLTIAQWMSFGIFGTGLAFGAYLWIRPVGETDSNGSLIPSVGPAPKLAAQ